MTGFSVEPVRHRALGPLVRLTLGDRIHLDLTAQEAGILSRALSAVRAGRSEERSIFLSPIASDGDFSASVDADGIVVAGIAPLRLPWVLVERLAAALADNAGT